MSPTNALTPREIEVLALLAEGHSNKQVAWLLGVSPKTSDTIRTRAYAKLGLHCIADAVRFAVYTGLVDCRPPGDRLCS